MCLRGQRQNVNKDGKLARLLLADVFDVGLQAGGLKQAVGWVLNWWKDDLQVFCLVKMKASYVEYDRARRGSITWPDHCAHCHALCSISII